MNLDRLYLCSTALAGALLTSAPLFAQTVATPDSAAAEAAADASAIIVTGVRGAPRTASRQRASDG